MGTTMHDKKVALVTGANKGIGFEIGRQLGKLGFTVVLAARDEAKVNAAAARLQGEGLDAHGVVLDVTDPSTAEAAARGSTSGSAGSTCWSTTPGSATSSARTRGRRNSTWGR